MTHISCALFTLSLRAFILNSKYGEGARGVNNILIQQIIIYIRRILRPPKSTFNSSKSYRNDLVGKDIT